jgi:phycobilisome rod-core linker protein
MAIPSKNFTISTQNSRVEGVSNQDIEINIENEADKLIKNCYRQIFFHLLEKDREVYLESQLRNGSITVRDFIRGLFLYADSEEDMSNATTTTDWQNKS